MKTNIRTRSVRRQVNNNDLTTVKVTTSTRDKLEQLKRKTKVKSIAIVIDHLLEGSR